jgi:hypothetical protein
MKRNIKSTHVDWARSNLSFKTKHPNKTLAAWEHMKHSKHHGCLGNVDVKYLQQPSKTTETPKNIGSQHGGNLAHGTPRRRDRAPPRLWPRLGTKQPHRRPARRGGGGGGGREWRRLVAALELEQAHVGSSSSPRVRNSSGRRATVGPLLSTYKSARLRIGWPPSNAYVAGLEQQGKGRSGALVD